MSSLVLTEDQSMLARTASAFVAEHSPVSRLRKLRDSKDERGYSTAVYKQMAELGWTAIPFSEQDGGLGMGCAEVVIVMSIPRIASILSYSISGKMICSLTPKL